MYSKSKLNHTNIADEIYEYMRYEYTFLTHKGMELAKCKSTLANKLKRLRDFQVLNWSTALDEIAKVKSDNAPTPVQIITAIEKTAKATTSIVNQNVINDIVKDVINYEALWKSADDEGKRCFFIEHKFVDVPPYIRYWFMQYNKANRGWSAHESHMMIKYWALPYGRADKGAVVNNQKSIIKYFEERVDG
jgi:hypothetical protein|tara:strand:- start:205 stop:777 length:573 start_codon:yes stop_codon:yes gene_type:complete